MTYRAIQAPSSSAPGHVCARIVVVDGRYDGGWRRRDDALFLVLYFLYRFAWVGLRFIGHFVDLSLLLVVVQSPFRQFGRILADWRAGWSSSGGSRRR